MATVFFFVPLWMVTVTLCPFETFAPPKRRVLVVLVTLLPAPPAPPLTHSLVAGPPWRV